MFTNTPSTEIIEILLKELLKQTSKNKTIIIKVKTNNLENYSLGAHSQRKFGLLYIL